MKYCILVQGPKLWNEFFAKQRRGNPILLTFSKNLKIKVYWNRKRGYVLLKKLFYFLNFYSVNTNQSKI